MAACGEPVTVTVTKTVLQDAATSTTTTEAADSNNLIATAPASAFPPSNTVSSSIDIQSSFSSVIAFGYLPSVTTDTTLTTTAPGTTLTISLISATPSSITIATHSRATSSTCTKSTFIEATATSKPSHISSPSLSGGSRTPAGTIAGGVIGSVAGLGLLIALLLYFCRHKRKFSFKRKVVKKNTLTADQEEQLQTVAQELSEIKTAIARASVVTGSNKPLPAPAISPRSFDFGLPKIHRSPIMPHRWL
jgi:hypothetical protein